MGIFAILLIYALWSSVFALGKLALQGAAPFFLISFRMLLAAVAILGFLKWKHKALFALSSRQWLALFSLGFVSIYLTNILEFWSLQYLPAAKACFIYSLSPFFAAFFSYIHFKEKMNLQKWIGLTIGLIAVLPVLSIQDPTESLFALSSLISWPGITMILASLFSVYGWILMRVCIKKESLSPAFSNGMSMGIGGFLALIHSFLFESWHPLPVEPGMLSSTIWLTCILTFISNILCYNLYGWLLKRYTATLLSFAGLLSPLFASLHAWLFLKEPFSPVILSSTLLLSLALWLVYSSELKQGYIEKAEAIK
mgnify:CR=1 FL=1